MINPLKAKFIGAHKYVVCHLLLMQQIEVNMKSVAGSGSSRT